MYNVVIIGYIGLFLTRWSEFTRHWSIPTKWEHVRVAGGFTRERGSGEPLPGNLGCVMWGTTCITVCLLAGLTIVIACASHVVVRPFDGRIPFCTIRFDSIRFASITQGGIRVAALSHLVPFLPRTVCHQIQIGIQGRKEW